MTIRKSLAALALVIAAPASFYSAASQTASLPKPPPAGSVVELETILVDTDNLSGATGDVALSIDLDSSGAVAHAKAISGPKDLTSSAMVAARMFRYHDQANESGLVQHILFRHGGDEVRMVTPDFPSIAARAHAGGLVELVATVGPNGHVIDVTVLSGHPLLRNQAENALRQWIFRPVLKNGVAVPCRAIVSFNFDTNRFPN